MMSKRSFERMSSVKLSDGLINASATLGLVEFVRRERRAIACNSLVENTAVLFGVSRAKALNTVMLLSEIGVFEIQDDKVFSSEEILGLDVLGARLVKFVFEQYDSIRLGDAIRFAEESSEIWIDAKRAPGRSLGIASLLFEVGVFQRDRLSSPFWRVTDQYREQFISAIAYSNDAIVEGTRTAKDLERTLNANLNAGNKAEDWVVSFEKRRLADHPLVSQVRRISEIQVDAGFDIVSFRDRSCIAHNWLIEVKSFLGIPRFHWTRNEIDCAKKEGERYVLYIVDRNQMQLQDYRPIMISGPYEHFFGSASPLGWSVDASEYRISSIN